MKLSQFKYNLPKELMPAKPADNRDGSRLMVINKKAKTIKKAAKVALKSIANGKNKKAKRAAAKVAKKAV